MVTRLPQLAQVASRNHQMMSKSSKETKALKTFEPQEHTCTGPKPLKSAPKGLGRLFLRHLNDGRIGRRNGIGTVLTTGAFPKERLPVLFASRLIL